MRTKDIAIMAVLSALYAALVNFLHPLSFMQVQVRVANALIGLVPIFGLPAVYGLTIGVFIGNLTSPLGPIDLISPVFSFIGLMIIYELRNESVFSGLLIYSMLLSVWVSFMLWYVFGLPYILSFLYVLIGITIATAGLGYLVYKSVSVRYGKFSGEGYERV